MAELAQTEAFQLQLGRFYAAWLSNEFMMDYAIGRLLLNISHEQTHILTSGMEFGRGPPADKWLERHQRSKEKGGDRRT